jgi:hypothetical protein
MSRGPRRDGEATAGAPRFGLWSSAKGVKREDDENDVGVTQSGHHLAVTPAARGRWLRRGRLAGPASGPKAGLGGIGGWRPAMHRCASPFLLGI